MQMKHPYLEEEQIPERYLMGKLSAEEAARFEEHYITCKVCLDRLELVTKFDRAVKGVASEEIAATAFSRRLAVLAWWARLARSRRAALALAAFALLVILPGGASWRQLSRLGGELDRARATLASLQTRQAEPQVNVPILRLSPERSPSASGTPAARLDLPPGLPSIVLSLELEGPDYPRYRVTLVGDGGGVVWQRADVERDPLGALVVIFPTSFFEAGDYSLRVDALPRQGAPIPLAPFALRVSR